MFSCRVINIYVTTANKPELRVPLKLVYLFQASKPPNIVSLCPFLILKVAFVLQTIHKTSPVTKTFVFSPWKDIYPKAKREHLFSFLKDLIQVNQHNAVPHVFYTDAWQSRAWYTHVTFVYYNPYCFLWFIISLANVDQYLINDTCLSLEFHRDITISESVMIDFEQPKLIIIFPP